METVKREVPYFKRNVSFEEFIRIEVVKNGGTQSVAFRDDLEYLCGEWGIDVVKGDTKDTLFNKMTKVKSYEELAKIFHIGVSSQTYQKAFGITHKDVKKLEKKEFLKKVGEYRFRAYGQYMYAPLYDIIQFVTIDEEELKRALE